MLSHSAKQLSLVLDYMQGMAALHVMHAYTPQQR
jgi:hypothetical protein